MFDKKDFPPGITEAQAITTLETIAVQVEEIMEESRKAYRGCHPDCMTVPLRDQIVDALTVQISMLTLRIVALESAAKNDPD